ncbi:hypothetical protein TrRE_jg11089, partial [Triparma retinervis]
MSEALRNKITNSPKPSDLLSAYGKYKKTHTTFNEIISTLSRKQATSYFKVLAKHARWIIEEEKYVPECCFEDADPENTMIVDKEAGDNLRFLELCSESLTAFSSNNASLFVKSPTASNEAKIEGTVVSLATNLHDLLLELGSLGVEEATRAQLAIMGALESWYLRDLCMKETLVLNVLPLVVIKSLDMDNSSADVARVNNLRSAFSLMDYKDIDTKPFRNLLLKTLSSPAYLKNEEGIKFLVHMMTIDEKLTGDMTRTYKSHIPKASKAQLRAYGEIFLLAWKKASAEDDETSLGHMEDIVIQPMMEASMMVAHAPTARAIRVLLSPIHEAKMDPSVDAMLHKLYSPILWRNLNAANPHVRLCASGIMADTFPLNDPESSAADKVKVINKTVSAMEGLLTDKDTRVRVAGAEAVGKVLEGMWDSLASKDVRSLLNLLVTQQACDATSPLVRAGAVTALTAILENSSSHGVLKALLPLLENLIHDNSEKVKVAMVKLLTKVKTMRGLKFFHIVKVPHLHARLANEPIDSVVAKEMVDLLLNSYFPQGPQATSAMQMHRTIDFMRKSPEAAKVFYGTLHNLLSVGGIAKLTSMLLRCLTTAVDNEKKDIEAGKISMSAKSKKTKKRSKAAMETVEENEEEPSEATPPPAPQASGSLSASNAALMATISETIFILWSSISEDLSKAQHKSSQKFLYEAFQGAVLTDAYAHFEAKERAAASDNDGDTKCYANRVCAALLRTAGNMPPSEITGLVAALTAKLQQAANVVDVTEEIGRDLTPHIALLCLWGKEDAVAVSLGKSIERFFSEDDDDEEEGGGEGDASSGGGSAAGKKRKKKEISKNGAASLLIPNLKASAALIVLKNIMGGSDTSSVSARSKILNHEVACKVLEASLESARAAAERIIRMESGDVMKEGSDDIVIGACEIYGRMALHKEASLSRVLAKGPAAASEIQLNPSARSLLTWLSDKVVPFLAKPRGGGEDEDEDILGIEGALSPIAKPSRSKRKATEQDKDESFAGAGAEGVLGRGEGKALAIQLVKSGLIIFGEWLAVGGSGGAEISKRIAAWGSSLMVDDEVRGSLLLAYGRALLQLCSGGEEARGVWRGILKCDDLSVQEEGVVKGVFAGILRTNARAAVEEIYAAATNGLSGGDKEYGRLARTVEELCPKEAGVPAVAKYCLALALQHGPAAREMARLARAR